jgi:hypothetical protein
MEIFSFKKSEKKKKNKRELYSYTLLHIQKIRRTISDGIDKIGRTVEKYKINISIFHFFFNPSRIRQT